MGGHEGCKSRMQRRIAEERPGRDEAAHSSTCPVDVRQIPRRVRPQSRLGHRQAVVAVSPAAGLFPAHGGGAAPSLSKTIISETGLNAKSIGSEESCTIIREIMHNHR